MQRGSHVVKKFHHRVYAAGHILIGSERGLQVAMVDVMQFARCNVFRAEWILLEDGQNFILLTLPCRLECFRVGPNICAEESLHIRWIGCFERRNEHGTVEGFDIKMARHPEDSERCGARSGADLRDVTRRAVDSDGRDVAKMFDVSPTDTNRPAKLRVGNQPQVD